MKKKILSGILVLAMMLTMIPTAFAAASSAATVASTTTGLGVAASSAHGSTAPSLTSKDNGDGTYSYTFSTGELEYLTAQTYNGTANTNGHFLVLDFAMPTGWVASSKVATAHKVTLKNDDAVVKTYDEKADAAPTFYAGTGNAATVAFLITPATKNVSVEIAWNDGTNDKTETHIFDVTGLKLNTASGMSITASTGAVTSAPVGTAKTWFFLKNLDGATLNVASLGFTHRTMLTDVETTLKLYGMSKSESVSLNAKNNGDTLIAVAVDKNDNVLAVANVTLASLTGDYGFSIKKGTIGDGVATLNVKTSKNTTFSGAASSLLGVPCVVKFDGPTMYVELEVVAATPNYSIDKVTVNGEEVTLDGSGKVVFPMPEKDVIINVTTKKAADFDISVGAAVNAKLNDAKNAVTGTLVYASSKWELPLVVNMNTEGMMMSNLNIVSTVDGGAAQTETTVNASTTIAVNLGTKAASKLVVEVKDTVKKETLKTWTIDLSGVNYAMETSVISVTSDAIAVTNSDVLTNVANVVAANGEVLVIKTSGTATTDFTASFAQSALETIANAGLDATVNVTLSSKDHSFTLSNSVLNVLADKTKYPNGVALYVKPVSTAATIANETANAEAKPYGSTSLVEVSFYELKVDGTVDTTKEINVKGTITLTLDFGLTKSVLDAIGSERAIGYISNDGKTSGVITDGITYDALGNVTFTTNHLTKFYITTVEKTSTPSKPSTPSIPTIPGNVPGSTIVTPGKDNDEAEDNTMSYDEAVAYVENMTDVAENNWFYNEVVWAVQNGVMLGTSKSTFAPNTNMTLYQTLTVLGRFDGEIIDDATWMADAKAWALENGILAKEEDEGDISRERLVYLLYTYAKATGADVSAKGDLSKFTDAADVSDWAVEAMTWAVGAGIIKGDNVNGVDMLNAGGTTTRAQVVTVLMRYADILA